MEENGLATPLPKRILVPSNTESHQKIWIFPALSYKIQKKIFNPTKNIFGWRVYTMENKDTKKDYQEVVRAGNQKWEKVKITNGIIFFVRDS